MAVNFANAEQAAATTLSGSERDAFTRPLLDHNRSSFGRSGHREIDLDAGEKMRWNTKRFKSGEMESSMVTAAKWVVSTVAAAAFVGLAHAQSLVPKNRDELKRTNLTGTSMEVVLSTAEYHPGEFIPLHIHHGEEAFYVIQGATVETPDGKQIKLATGAGSINLRNVPHAGFKVVGDTPLKLVTVHIVDKGTPLYDNPPK